MSFEIECPNCGVRPLWEFHFAGATRSRPGPEASNQEWTDYVYLRPNLCGEQTEWWYHRSACKLWFKARRNTRTNEMLEVLKPEPQETSSE